MAVQLMRVAAVAAVLTLSAAVYADDANPDSKALLEYVKKLENRVNQLEQEKQWPLDQVRAASGSALESAVHAVNLSGYMEFQYGYNIRHGGRDSGSSFTGIGSGTGSGTDFPVVTKALGVGSLTSLSGRGDAAGFNRLAGTSADENGFSFQNLQLLADRPLTTADSVGFRVRSEFGLVSKFNDRDGTFNANGQAFDVREAFVSWRANVGGMTDHVDFTVGRMDTPLGAEKADNTENWLVTQSFQHVLATPVTHTGVRAVLPWSDCCSTAVYIVNGWDNVRDANDGKTIIVSQNISNLEWMNSSITGNVSYGDEGSLYNYGTGVTGAFAGSQNAPDGNKTKFFEAIWRGDIDQDNKVAVDGFWATADNNAPDSGAGTQSRKFHGASAYLRHQWTKTSWIGARAEWYCDTTGGAASDLRVWGLSLAGGWELAQDLELILEVRHDHAMTSEPFEGKSPGNFMKSQDRVTASVLFRF